MSKETAVEWLIELWCKNRGNLIPEDFEQAKEMEKEQHKSTFRAILNTHYFDFEQYYNETFNK